MGFAHRETVADSLRIVAAPSSAPSSSLAGALRGTVLQETAVGVDNGQVLDVGVVVVQAL
ncbi:hypothetical protein [Kocuria rosea]|uniref:hypothetical protein n=1 Tax=Kocuria rosea TaxID=1275 RepID=UPI0025B77C43|nr:hypothetical protein [Kocuria rosea]WJZ65495.1 hypothetical protein QR564_12055 [Kocuria rosea]